MGCMQVCEDKPIKAQYDYKHQLKFIKETISQIIYFNKNFNNQFVSKCYQQICHNPKLFILKYTTKIQQKQSVPVNILEKWKMILYGSGYEDEIYVTALGYNNNSFEEEKLKQDRTFKLSKQNPFQIDLNQLYYHQSYTQIQKDVVRKYEIPQLKQESFQRILKKISNYFPSTGYALGINYIIGYFLIVGYSEFDSFWLFVHLALNKRFLALGLFEQGFPLARLLILVFKNVIKRTNRAVYQHIFQKMLIDDSMWILKWFMSFYLSSFPIEACQYAWDITFALGIIGLVFFGISLMEVLSEKILNIQDEGDIIMLFKSLNNIQNFNEIVNIEKVMTLAYSISLQQEDFQNIQTLKKDFYSTYFQLFRQQLRKQTPTNKLIAMQSQKLAQFYKQILQERDKFKVLARQSGTKFFQPPTNERQISSQQKNKQQKSSQNACKNSQQQSLQLDQSKEIDNDHSQRYIRSVQNSKIHNFEQKFQQKHVSPIKRIRSQTLLSHNKLQKINIESLLSLVPNKIQINYIQKNITEKRMAEGQFKNNQPKIVNFQTKIIKDYLENNYQNLEQKDNHDKIKKEVNQQPSYISSQIKVRSVKNDSQNQQQEQLSRLQEFLSSQKKLSNKKVKSKLQLQIQDVEQSNKSIQKQSRESGQRHFLKSQLQGIQSQFHISIYNIQQEKDRYEAKDEFQSRERTCSKNKSINEENIQESVLRQFRVQKNDKQINQIPQSEQKIYKTVQNIQNITNGQVQK